MRQKSQTRQTGAAKAIKDIRRATRKQYSAEEKIRIVLDGLRGEETIAELCRISAQSLCGRSAQQCLPEIIIVKNGLYFTTSPIWVMRWMVRSGIVTRDNRKVGLLVNSVGSLSDHIKFQKVEKYYNLSGCCHLPLLVLAL